MRFFEFEILFHHRMKVMADHSKDIYYNYIWDTKALS